MLIWEKYEKPENTWFKSKHLLAKITFKMYISCHFKELLDFLNSLDPHPDTDLRKTWILDKGTPGKLDHKYLEKSDPRKNRTPNIDLRENQTPNIKQGLYKKQTWIFLD